jgi:hypothetical protein
VGHYGPRLDVGVVRLGANNLGVHAFVELGDQRV